MYATKPLSLFRSNPEAASLPSPEGPTSGYLVVKDDDYDGGDDVETCCWGACGRNHVRDLPFPQNRVLKVDYGSDEEDVVFVPVPDQPLASNRYHAVIAKGMHKGLVRACSREEEETTCCFGCQCIKDVKPRLYNPADVYQQMEIVQHRRGQFTARAVAPDGLPPFLYRAKYWRVHASKPKKFNLREAPGLNAALRPRQLADANLFVDGFAATTSKATSSTVVGKWYCPFYLIKEGSVSRKKQMDRAAFYEVFLEQRWEPVLGNAVPDPRVHGGSKLESKRALIGGSVEAKREAARSQHGDGYVWFRAASGQSAGVCASVWERMLWEEHRGGWVDEEDAETMATGGGSVLVERFVVKRMDGSVAVAFDFVHLNKFRAAQPV